MNLLIKLSLVFSLGLSIMSAHSYESEYRKWHDPVAKREMLYEITDDVVLNWPTIPGLKDYNRDQLVALLKSKHQFAYPYQLTMQTPYIYFSLYIKQGAFVDIVSKVYSQPANGGALEYWVSNFDPLTTDMYVKKSCRFMVVKQSPDGKREIVKDSEQFFADYQSKDSKERLSLPLDSGRVVHHLDSARYPSCYQGKYAYLGDTIARASSEPGKFEKPRKLSLSERLARKMGFIF